MKRVPLSLVSQCLQPKEEFSLVSKVIRKVKPCHMLCQLTAVFQASSLCEVPQIMYCRLRDFRPFLFGSLGSASLQNSWSCENSNSDENFGKRKNMLRRSI